MPDETTTTPQEPAVDKESAEKPTVESAVESGPRDDCADKWRLLSLVLTVALVATLVASALLWRDLRGQVQSAEAEE